MKGIYIFNQDIIFFPPYTFLDPMFINKDCNNESPGIQYSIQLSTYRKYKAKK